MAQNSAAMAGWAAILIAAVLGACAESGPDDGGAPDSGLGVPFDDTEAKAIVLCFVRTDCPIANAYAPRLKQISDRYGARGVRFWLVYPDASESDAAIREHLDEYSLPLEYLRDPEHQLVSRVGARVTPEAAVFVSGGGRHELVYCGRIDDQYVEWGKRRREPSQHDLAEVLDAVLEGDPKPFARTSAVGCSIPALD